MYGSTPNPHPAVRPTLARNEPLTEAAAWALLLARRGRTAGRPAPPVVEPADSACPWPLSADLTPPVRDLLDLYRPLCRPAPTDTPFVIGHLGQSLDGFIATCAGESRYINDPANITHLHRLRALCDAVIVGAGTVAADDPRLTTREVPGPDPVRIILDPRRRLPAGHRVFQDGAAPTLLCCTAGLAAVPAPGQAELLSLPAGDGGLDLAALVAALARRGLRVLFVEGGGVTVSAFLRAGLLDRLHLALAPLLLGDGRRGVVLPAAERLDGALRPLARVYPMGRDVLFDCDLGASGQRAGAAD